MYDCIEICATVLSKSHLEHLYFISPDAGRTHAILEELGHAILEELGHALLEELGHAILEELDAGRTHCVA